MIQGKTVLVTGGTGSFGLRFVSEILANHNPRKVIVFSRDELKQHNMSLGLQDGRVRFFLGDVRDIERLRIALREVDIVVHSAALKQVPACEYNPSEAILTNVLGSQNVARAAIDCGVRKVIGLSTDKACNPVTLYGATKLCAEKTILAHNAYVGSGRTTLSMVRYGNIAGSRGSVIPVWRDALRLGNPITITDKRMTRFWMTQQEAVDLVLLTINASVGGETFIPKLPAFAVPDLALALGARGWVESGVRQGEKLHESLIGHDESRYAKDMGTYYVLGTEPSNATWAYSSDESRMMSVAEIRQAVERMDD